MFINNLIKALPTLLILVLLMYSCNTNDKKKLSVSQKEVFIDSNAILTLIRPSIKNDSLETVVKLLGLENIQAKINISEIRIWLEYSASDSGKLIILKGNGEYWQSYAYYYKYNFNGNGRIVFINKKIESKKPISGWQNFLKDLEALKIYKLRNYNQIPKYSACMDPDQLMIEIWKNNQYRMYEYPCFEVNAEEMGNEDVKEIMQIGFLIQKEFGYRIFDR